jgi:hypothetical protein
MSTFGTLEGLGDESHPQGALHRTPFDTFASRAQRFRQLGKDSSERMHQVQLKLDQRLGTI